MYQLNRQVDEVRKSIKAAMLGFVPNYLNTPNTICSEKFHQLDRDEHHELKSHKFETAGFEVSKGSFEVI